MKTTTPKKLREELKSYLDQAAKAPVKVKRRSGETFIIISEEKYLELKGEPSKEPAVKATVELKSSKPLKNKKKKPSKEKNKSKKIVKKKKK